MIFELEKDLMVFPHPELPELDDPSGFVAIGGDLSVERLLLAYDYGFFPWYAFKDMDIHWYCPRQRFVIFPGEVHVSHSMRTLMNKNLYRVTFDVAFDQAIRSCSTVDNRINQIGAWLGDDIIAAYSKLHELGRAHSVEVWRGEELVGDLYGVESGTGFVGESMFSREPNTSKLALIALARRMQEHGGSLIDCQVHSPHLQRMGARLVSYKEYITALHGEGAYRTWQEMPFIMRDAEFNL